MADIAHNVAMSLGFIADITGVFDGCTLSFSLITLESRWPLWFDSWTDSSSTIGCILSSYMLLPWCYKLEGICDATRKYYAYFHAQTHF